MSRNATLYTYGEPVASIELSEFLRQVEEPLTPAELRQFQHPTKRLMIVGWCVFSLLFVTILASTLWVHTVLAAGA